jgi:Spy/CpxP family protein refolding chaperone
MTIRPLTIPFVLAVAGLLATGPTLAGQRPVTQDPQRPDPQAWRMPPAGPEQQLARLSEQLQLSDEQSRKLLEVLQAARDERAILHARIMEEMQPEICTQMRNTEADILAILTPEQAEQFQLLKEQRQARQGERWGHDGFSPPECPADDG